MSITLAAARLGAILGNIVFGVFVDVSCAIPILLVAALLICKPHNLVYFPLNLLINFHLLCSWRFIRIDVTQYYERALAITLNVSLNLRL